MSMVNETPIVVKVIMNRHMPLVTPTPPKDFLVFNIGGRTYQIPVLGRRAGANRIHVEHLYEIEDELRLGCLNHGINELIIYDRVEKLIPLYNLPGLLWVIVNGRPTGLRTVDGGANVYVKSEEHRYWDEITEEELSDHLGCARRLRFSPAIPPHLYVLVNAKMVQMRELAIKSAHYAQLLKVY